MNPDNPIAELFEEVYGSSRRTSHRRDTREIVRDVNQDLEAKLA